MSTEEFTIGVEEEFLVVDAATARCGPEASALVDRVLAGGTGADRQRRVLAETGDERAVLDFIVEETCPARGRTEA